MQTRFQSNKSKENKFEYDFDDASKCWKENKKFVGNGCYKYICEGVTKKGLKCKCSSLDGELYCKIHLSKKE